jgi:hypothetical protein
MKEKRYIKAFERVGGWWKPVLLNVCIAHSGVSSLKTCCPILVTSVMSKAINMPGVGTIRSKSPVELVGYEDEEAGNFIGDNRSTWLLPCEVHNCWFVSKWVDGDVDYVIIGESLKALIFNNFKDSHRGYIAGTLTIVSVWLYNSITGFSTTRLEMSKDFAWGLILVVLERLSNVSN